MKLIKQIKDVKAYLQSKDVVLKENEIISLKNNLKEIVDNACRVFDLNREILVLDDSNVPYIFDLDLKLINKISDFEINVVKFPFVGFYFGKAPRTYGIIDFETSKKLFEIREVIGREIIGDYIFTTDITCRSVRDGDILWHFDLSSIPNNPHDDNYAKEADWEVKKFIGVLEGKLWIALNHHTIIALDILTGSLIHQIHDIPDFRSEWLPSAIPLSEATVIDSNNNKLIGFMWEFYWEIDPLSGEISLLDLSEEFLSQKIRNDVHNYVLTDETIYFISHFDSKIGALDRLTKRIVWHYDFVKDETGREPRIRELQGGANMLGALSSDNTLYIFKKEDQ